MIADVLKEMRNITYFNFYHEQFPNMSKIKNILENQFGMKAEYYNNSKWTFYKKE